MSCCSFLGLTLGDGTIREGDGERDRRTEDEACGLDVHTFTSRRAFRDEMITSVRIRDCGGEPNITKTLVQKSV